MHRKLITAALLLATLGAPLAAGAIESISVSEMQSRAQTGRGYSYWWGGGRWDMDSKRCTGACSGSCGACSHWGSPSGCPEYGADCSGFVYNVWQLGPRDTQQSSHGPFTASRWMSTQSGYWTRVSNGDTRAGDARASSTHVYFVYNRSPSGGIVSMEAVGCAIGIIQSSRSTGDGKISARRGSTSGSSSGGGGSVDDPPRRARKPHGPASGREGDRMSYCTSARDPERDRVGYKFVFERNGRKVAKITRTARSGSTMCVSHDFPRPGTYKVYAYAYDKIRRSGKVVRRYGPRSEILRVRIGDDSAADSPAPVPKRPINGATVTTLHPWFQWTQVRGPPTVSGNRAQLRYDLQIFDVNPRVTSGAQPIFTRSLRIGDEARIEDGKVKWTPPDALGDFLPPGARTYYWRVRACFWGDCTPWSSSAARRYATFRVEANQNTTCGPGGVAAQIPPTCNGVIGDQGESCTSGSQCGAGQACVVTIQGAGCASRCAIDADCGAGTVCRPTSNAAMTPEHHCIPEAATAETCFCDLRAAYQSCGYGGAVLNPPASEDLTEFVRVYACQ